MELRSTSMGISLPSRLLVPSIPEHPLDLAIGERDEAVRHLPAPWWTRALAPSFA
jgi:hypothetical protein